MTDTEKPRQRTVAITSAGAGLGRELAIKLAKTYRVFGTALSPDEVTDMVAASDGSVTLTVCDITDESAVWAWTGQVTDAVGDSGLDVLVSNAGILTPGIRPTSNWTFCVSNWLALATSNHVARSRPRRVPQHMCVKFAIRTQILDGVT